MAGSRRGAVRQPTMSFQIEASTPVARHQPPRSRQPRHVAAREMLFAASSAFVAAMSSARYGRVLRHFSYQHVSVCLPKPVVPAPAMLFSVRCVRRVFAAILALCVV